MNSPTKFEWHWSLKWLGITLLISIFPIILGVLTSPPGGEFSGFLFNAGDGNTYLAKMEEGRQGSWLFHLVHTPEKGGSGAFIFVLYLLMGKVAGLFGLPNLAMYHLSRLVFGAGLLATSYYVICLLFERKEAQRLAFLLVCFSSGFGWFTFLISYPPPDFWVSESLTFFSIFANPHFPLATMLLILTLTWSFFGLQGRKVYFLAAAGTSFLMGFIQPFLLFTIAAVLAVYWLRLVIEERKEPNVLKGRILDAVCLIGVGLAGAPGPLITLVGTSTDPLLKSWMSQNQTLSLDPLTVAGGYSVMPLAIIGWWKAEVSLKMKGLASVWKLISTWAILTPVLLYLPVGFQRRLEEGWHLPLVCLAVLGWMLVVWPWLDRKWPKLGFKRLAFYLTLICSISTVLLLGISLALLFPVNQSNTTDPVFSTHFTAGEVGAFRWLTEHSTEDEVVITGPVLGNYLPAHAHNRVFYGHVMETINSESKLFTLSRFFASTTANGLVPMTNEERRSIIRQWNIKYLLYGWRERDLGDFDPSQVGWPIVYNQNDVKIYKLDNI